jgi:LPXTG-motif cell wall-anchored protein
VFATPASAHTPKWAVDCESVSVDLTRYSGKHTNTVTIKAGGKDLLSETFGTEFHKELDIPQHSKDVEVVLSVKAGDDDKFSLEEKKTSPVCEGDDTPEPPASSAPPNSPEPEPSESAPEQPPTSSAPANGPAPATTAPAGDLAETGSSSSTPVVAGIAGAVLVAGAGLVFVTRRRSAARQ